MQTLAPIFQIVEEMLGLKDKLSAILENSPAIGHKDSQAILDVVRKLSVEVAELDELAVELVDRDY